jgi:hypothetical protein
MVKTTRNSIAIVSIVLLGNQASGMQQRVVQSAKRPATTQLRHAVGTVAAQ